MRMISRVLGTVAVAGIALLGPAPAVFAASADKDCSDFQYQEDAQAVYDQDPTDPNNLDADNDGIACETLPHRGSGQTSTSTKAPGTLESSTTKTTTKKTSTSAQVQVKPAGGVDTGGGDGGDSGSGPAIALGALVLGGGGAVTTLLLRRRANR